MIDVARIKKRKYFAEAEYNVKLKKTDVVEELLEFGILYRQPMAIYMGEKLAMMTGQTIPISWQSEYRICSVTTDKLKRTLPQNAKCVSV